MDSSELPDWIKLKMEEKGISASELARRSGVSKQTISDYRNRKRPYPDERTLIKIAEGLGEPPQAVLRAAGLLPDLPTPRALYEEIVKHRLSLLNDDQLEDVLKYVDFIMTKDQKPMKLNKRQG